MKTIPNTFRNICYDEFRTPGSRLITSNEKILEVFRSKRNQQGLF